MKTNKIYIRFLLSLWLVAVSFTLFAQEDDPEDPCLQVMGKSIAKDFKKARDFQKEGKKEEAITIYEQLLEQDPTLLEVNYYYAMIYYYPISSNNFKITNKNNANKAMEAFNRIYEVCPFYKATYCLYAARLAYMMEEFDEATKFAKVLVENPDIVKNMDQIDEAQLLIERSHFYGTILKNPVPFNPIQLPGISTNADEYLATISPDGSEFYFTRRQEVSSGT
jgi:tetratricopeptide (TPR) repeat protein